MAYKKLFIDSDIILDFLLGREPFASYAKPLVSDRLNLKIYTSALVLANVHYIVARDKNKHIAKDFLQDLMPLFHVLPFTEESIHFALNYNTVDFEDTMQYFIAHKNK